MCAPLEDFIIVEILGTLRHSETPKSCILIATKISKDEYSIVYKLGGGGAIPLTPFLKSEGVTPPPFSFVYHPEQ